MTFRVLAARTGAADYTFVLLCSAVYWLRVEAGATRDWLPKSLLRQYRLSVPNAEAFLRECRIPIRAFRAYTAWIADTPPDDEDELAGVLAQHLKDLWNGMNAVKRNLSATDEQVQAINNLRLWHKTENPNTLEKIRNSLTSLDMPPVLLEHFKAETKSQKPFVTELQKLVKKLSGATGLSIPLEQREEIRADYPELWKSYLALRREILAISKQELRDLVRSKGGSANIDDVRREFDRRKIYHNLPKGFKGNIGEDGGLQTNTGVAIDKANQIDPGSKIVMNPQYTPRGDSVAGRNNNWYFKVILPTTDARGKNNEQYFYTTTKASQNRQHKFGVVQKLIDSETKMVARWRKDLKQNANWDHKVLAAMCEIVYLTCSRIGGKGAGNRNGSTYGLSTLLVGNVKRRGNSIVLDYIGKDSVQQKHVIDPTTPETRAVISVIETLAEGKPRKEALWEHDGTVYSALKVNNYFKLICGVPGATIHKLRHLRGTRLAITELGAELEKLKAKRTISQPIADKAFQNAMTTVGSILGHVRGVGAAQKATWQTSVKNYVEPSIMVDFYTQLAEQGIRMPKFLKSVKTD